MRTRTRRKTAERAASGGEARGITELAQAFRVYEGLVPGLSIDVVGHVAGSRVMVHPIAGFHVRLPSANDTGASLYVSARYGELVRWRPGAGALRERFEVNLDDAGYGWGDSVYPTAAELAHDLIAYLQFNVDALLKH
ncbi:MAG TPA: hypothetical protein VK929_12420 [Longimicrobiales bacterium]|nr:hypothetical protein [Longimicrobiales bacterium]